MMKSNVIDKLEIIYPRNFIVPVDSEIRENIENVLHWNADISSNDIRVFVEGGVVNLRGTVGAYREKWKAEDLVSSVRGVKKVVNELAIVTTSRLLDRDIASDIQNAIERNLIVDSEEVIVKVEDAKVILTGVVPSSHVRSETGKIARYTSGVVEVENKLLVESLAEMTN